MRNFSLNALLSLSLIAAVFFVPTAAEAKKCDTMTPYVVDSWPGILALSVIVARDLGPAAEECLEISVGSNGPIIKKIAALVSGKADTLLGTAAAQWTHVRNQELIKNGAKASDLVWPKYIGSVANGSAFMMVGITDNLYDLVGNVTLTSRLGSPGVVGPVRTGPFKDKTLANPTEPFWHFVDEYFPAYVRKYGLEPTENKESDPKFAELGHKTIYLKAARNSSERRKALLAGEVDYVFVTYETGLTMLDEKRRDGKAIKLVLDRGVLPKTPAAMIAVLDPSDPKHAAFKRAVTGAVRLMWEDPERIIKHVMKIAQDPAQRTAFRAMKGDRLEERARELLKFGLQGGLWSSTGCIPVQPFRLYQDIFQVKGDEKDYLAPGALCSR